MIATAIRPHKFAFGQDDLERICAERELKTSERHCINDVYGQASILKRYAGLPDAYPLRAIIEHGVFISGKMMEYDRAAWLPVALSPTLQRAQFVQQECGKRAIPIGFSYLYAMRLLERQGRSSTQRHGTVVFPVHSMAESSVHFDHHDYAQRLAHLEERFRPVVVCMYWKDVQLGHHTAYLQRGLQVVSAGHMFDPNFLLHFGDISRQFRYAAANFIGTNLFLSVASGCRFFYLPSGEIRHDFCAADQQDSSLEDETFQGVQQASHRIFAEPVEEVTAEQRAFVDSHLGTAWVRTPKSLASVLLRTRLHDMLYPVSLNGQRGWQSWVPLAWRRKLRGAGWLSDHPLSGKGAG